MIIQYLAREHELIQVRRDAKLALIDRLLIRIQPKQNPMLMDDPPNVEKGAGLLSASSIHDVKTIPAMIA